MRIDPDRIHFFKFILEAYDNFAVLSTVDASSGLVRLRFPPGVDREVRDLCDSLLPALIRVAPSCESTK